MDVQTYSPSNFMQFQIGLAYFLPFCQVISTLAFIIIAIQQVKIAKRLGQISESLDKKNNI